MRINKFIAQFTGLSRRSVDTAISSNRILVNGQPARIGQDISSEDTVTLDGKIIEPTEQSITIMLNKPRGFVVSRVGQGSRTIYDLLPNELRRLKPVGRLDKDSSGLLLLTDDGSLANKLTHPKFMKQKIYQVKLDKPLDTKHKTRIEQGVLLTDGLSKMSLTGNSTNWTVTISEGRNRQIRRTYEKLNYRVINLHRIKFGNYNLDGLEIGKYKIIK